MDPDNENPDVANINMPHVVPEDIGCDSESDYGYDQFILNWKKYEEGLVVVETSGKCLRDDGDDRKLPAQSETVTSTKVLNVYTSPAKKRELKKKCLDLLNAPPNYRAPKRDSAFGHSVQQPTLCTTSPSNYKIGDTNTVSCSTLFPWSVTKTHNVSIAKTIS